MVISSNPKPDQSEFAKLLNNTVATLQSEANKKPRSYLKLLGRDLELTVFDIMSDNARGTDFENTIELISGQKFPDIIAMRYFGVEVKTTKLDHWTTTGNSIMEGTRVENIERIYMLFGKMQEPIAFKCRPYEECLSEVVVTHSPRYQIDMELNHGETIFDKINVPYDTLRKSSNPFKPIIDYYKQFLNPGDEFWWLGQDEGKNKGLIIKTWNNLPVETRHSYMINAMILFPEIFGNGADKYNSLSVWLINRESIVCPNIRDVFTAGGKGQIIWNNKTYTGIPRIIINLLTSLPNFKTILDSLDNSLISYYWDKPVKNKRNQLIEMIVHHSNYMKLPFNLKAYLKSNLQ